MGKTLQIKKLEGVISGLAKEFEQLNPRPDRLIFPTPCLRSSFNNVNGPLQSYLKNAPRRLSLERRLLIYKRRLATLQNSVPADSLELAA